MYIPEVSFVIAPIPTNEFLNILCIFVIRTHREIKRRWKSAWRVLIQLKIDLPYEPAVPLLRIYPNKVKSVYEQVTYNPTFTAEFTNVKI